MRRRLAVVILIAFGLFATISEAQLNDVAEVRQILNDIKVASIKKHGAFSDIDPTLLRARQRIQPPDFDDGTEMSANRAVADDLFENDIVLTLPQAKAILTEVVNDSQPPTGRRRPMKRQAAPATNSWWRNPGAIPYVFQYSDASWQALIRQAQQHIASETCIRFYEANAAAPPADHLQFIRGSGCWSSVGRVGGRQQVSIGYGCDALGIAAHEMLHALGLWHEQSRTDRDAFILVYYDYIYPGTQSNFEKRTTANSDNMGQPYDLGSVMHYGSRAFSTSSDKYSLATRDANYQQTIGQRARISFKDAKMINLRYCANVCSTQLNCKNGGYTNPNDCTSCKCPVGYGGTLCDQLPSSNVQSCRGGDYSASSRPNLLRSPYITARSRCYFRITAGDNQKIELTFTQIDFPCKDVCESYVEIKYRSDKTATGARMCCGLPKSTIVSDGPEVLVIFYGADDDSLQQGYKGFQLTYKAVNRSTVMTTTAPTPIWSRRTAAPTTIRRCWWRWQYGRWRTICEDNYGRTWPYGEAPTGAPITTVAKTTTVMPVDSSTDPSTSAAVTTTAKPTTDGTGEWSAWGAWGVCSVSCGGCGVRRRVRACYGGNGRCNGLSYDSETCGQSPCPISTKTTRCQGRLLMPCDLLAKLDFGTVLSENTIFNADATSTARSSSASTAKAQPKPAAGDNFARRVRQADEMAPFIEFGSELAGRPAADDDESLQHLLDTERNAKILDGLKLRPQDELNNLSANTSSFSEINSSSSPSIGEREPQSQDQTQSRARRFVDGSKLSDARVYCEKKFSYNCPTYLLTISMDWNTKKETQSRDTRRCCSGYYLSGDSCVKSR